MNKIFKYSLALMVTALGFTACSDDDDNYQPGEWNAAAGYFDVAFPAATLNEELDPTDPTETTLTILRRNTSGEATVPFEVLENTDNVFTIGEAHFAAGDSAATFKVAFPNAEVGKPYTLKLQVTDPQYSSLYASDALLEYTVTRVKWNDAGYYIDNDGQKVEGWALFTEDFITTFFGVPNEVMPTRLQERDDKPGYFRLINTYSDYAYLDPGEYDESRDYIFYIDATNPNKVFIPHYGEIGIDWGYGMMRVSSLSGLYLSRGGSDNIKLAEDYYGTYANGKITFPKDALLFSMADYSNGGFYKANGKGAFKLVIDPALDLYEADITTDFEWTVDIDGLFKSEQLDKSSSAVLYKGTCSVDRDGADERFAQAYGTAFMLENPYAEGYNLYFTVDAEGAVKVPEGLELQETGLSAVGTPVYAKISGANSSYSPNLLVLNITFQSKDGSLVYGRTDEQLEYISWSVVGNGVYTYTTKDYSSNQSGGMWKGTQNAVLYSCDQDDTRFKIAPWADQEGENGLLFSMDGEGTIVVDGAETGYVDEDWGMIYATDLLTYGAAQIASYYEDGVFVFNLAYHDYDGPWAYVQDTFTRSAASARAQKTARTSQKPRQIIAPWLNQKALSRQARLDARFAAKKTAVDLHKVSLSASQQAVAY